MTSQNATPVLMVAGNNCYASLTEQQTVVSPFDWAMLRPFAEAWPGDVLLLTTDSPGLHPRRLPLTGAAARQLLGRRQATGLLRIASMPIMLARMISRLRAEPGRAVVYARLPSPTGACGALAAAVTRSGLMCSLHGRPKWSRHEASWQRTLKLTGIYRRVAKRFLGRASVVFTTDAALGHVYGIEHGKLEALSNTLMEEVPGLPPTDADRDRPIRLCFAGRLTPEKNLSYALSIVEAMQRRGHEVTFAVIGDGPQRQELHELARRKQVSVEWLGWIADRDDLMSAVAEADFLILPSLYEGNPKILREAMACGTVVATWAINETVRSVTRDGELAVLLSNTELPPEEWSDAIWGYWIDLPRYTNLRAAAHESVADESVANLTRSIRVVMNREFDLAAD